MGFLLVVGIDLAKAKSPNKKESMKYDSRRFKKIMG